MRPLIDAHLDLAWNAVHFDRDLTLEIVEARQVESHMNDHRCRGGQTVTFPELRKARIPICVATLLARSRPALQRSAGYQRVDLDYPTRAGAYGAAHAQLAYYELMEQQGWIRMLRTEEDFDQHWNSWCGEETAALGILLSMEGADPIVQPDQLEQWWDRGLRAIGPAHYGHSHYAGGTDTCGPLTDDGRELLGGMDRLNMALDVTHLSDEAFDEAMETFQGPVWASHHNCRSLVNRQRQLTDVQIEALVKRDAVIGAALDAWMLYDPWQLGVTQPDVVAIEAVADHIDRVCQLAGSTRHSAIGSDLDGGFGTEQTPRDLDTIVDLQRIAELLSGRGYTDESIDAIFHGNWLRILRRCLP